MNSLKVKAAYDSLLYINIYHIVKVMKLYDI